jgi:aspartate aminotransferase-like enzyme
MRERRSDENQTKNTSVARGDPTTLARILETKESAWQREREQAERLEQGIKQLCLKTVKPEEVRLPAAG